MALRVLVLDTAGGFTLRLQTGHPSAPAIGFLAPNFNKKPHKTINSGAETLYFLSVSAPELMLHEK
jgi:hypothetical protein